LRLSEENRLNKLNKKANINDWIITIARLLKLRVSMRRVSGACKGILALEKREKVSSAAAHS
jgi:hypothetical protein